MLVGFLWFVQGWLVVSRDDRDVDEQMGVHSSFFAHHSEQSDSRCVCFVCMVGESVDGGVCSEQGDVGEVVWCEVVLRFAWHW